MCRAEADRNKRQHPQLLRRRDSLTFQTAPIAGGNDRQQQLPALLGQFRRVKPQPPALQRLQQSGKGVRQLMAMLLVNCPSQRCQLAALQAKETCLGSLELALQAQLPHRMLAGNDRLAAASRAPTSVRSGGKRWTQLWKHGPAVARWTQLWKHGPAVASRLPLLREPRRTISSFRQSHRRIAWEAQAFRSGIEASLQTRAPCSGLRNLCQRMGRRATASSRGAS